MCSAQCLLVFLLLVVTPLSIAISENLVRDYEYPDIDDTIQSVGSTTLSVCRRKQTGQLYTTGGTDCDADDRIASGTYRDSVNQNGWGILEIFTKAGQDPATQAYAAGLVEGELTKEQIRNHYRNTVDGMCNDQKQYCKKLFQYLRKNLHWIEQTLQQKPADDIYWNQVNLTLMQLTGIEHGYRGQASVPQISFELSHIYMLQLSGEFIDLEKMFGRKKLPGDDVEASKCSGFVKLAERNADLFFSHVSMSGYNTMNRLLKLYHFGLDPVVVPGHAVAMSSYPATLASLDDFVLTSSGLAAMETTFAIFNQSLYSDQFIKPVGQLHCWLRSVIASRLASSASEWVKIFARYNSGTYNNQWSVLDYNKFKPGKPLVKADLLWVLEQAPGYVVARDLTAFLANHTYWPSYNIPYFEEMSRYSGFAEKGKQYDWFKWGASPRARIFERDHRKVDSLEQLRKLMRYNDYMHDEFSKCKCVPPYTAEGGISTRGDLNPSNGTYELESMGHRNHGGIDYKGTNVALARNLQFRAWGGPTYDPLPVFSWATTDIVANHYGQPTVWNFTEIQLNWMLNHPLNYRLDRNDDQSI